MRRVPHVDNVEVRRAIQRLSSDTTGVEDAIGSLNGSVADIESDIIELQADSGLNARTETAEAAEDIQAGQPVYKLAGLTTIGVARADTIGKRNAVGVALEAKSSGLSCKYALYGALKLEVASLTPGSHYYIGDTGGITATPPTSGAVSLIGHALTTDVLNVRIERPIIL
jgi:hypothetical protein